MLSQARDSLNDTAREFSFEVIDAHSISYLDNTFDGVVANHMLYQVLDRAKGISEIQRVLKLGDWPIRRNEMSGQYACSVGRDKYRGTFVRQGVWSPFASIHSRERRE